MTSLAKCLYCGVFGRGNSSSGCGPNLCWRHRRSEPPTHINKGENTEPVAINGKHLTICAGQNMVRIDWPLSVFFFSLRVFLSLFLPFSLSSLALFLPLPSLPSLSPNNVDSLGSKIAGKVTLCLHLVCWWSDMPSLVTCCAARWKTKKYSDTNLRSYRPPLTVND